MEAAKFKTIQLTPSKVTGLHITPLKTDFGNVTFNVSAAGFVGDFIMYFKEERKGRAKYPSYYLMETYFLGVSTSLINGCKIEHVIDAVMMVERHAQWILEKVMGDINRGF